MREIKFRAWDKVEETMIYPVHFIERGDRFLGESYEQVIPAWSKGETEDRIFLQCTGLLDKQGKEIYEGDFLLIEDEYKDVILDDGTGPTEPYNHIAPVTFQDGSFGVRILEKGLDFDIGFWAFSEIQRRFGPTEFEIVGNLYKNPELLKEEEEPCLKLN